MSTYYVPHTTLVTLHTFSSMIETLLENRYYYFYCADLKIETQRSKENCLRKLQIWNLNSFRTSIKTTYFYVHCSRHQAWNTEGA